MDRLQALSDAISRYLDDRSSLEDLEISLAMLAAPAAEGDSVEAHRLSGALGGMLAELQSGHRTVEAFRHDLATELRESQARLAS